MPRLALLPLSLGLALPAFAWAAACEKPAEAWVCAPIPGGGFSCEGDFSTPRNELTLAETTKLRADEVNGDEAAVNATGQVELRGPNQLLQAPSLTYDRAGDKAQIQGPLRLEDQTIIVYAGEGSADLGQNTAVLSDLRFALKGTTAQGTAERADVDTASVSTLKNARFTSCPGEDPSWTMSAEQIDLQHEKDRGVARNMTVRIGDTPIFWFPYASFPLSNARKSGLLTPNISFGQDGLDYQQPYYLNLAPNYDLTLTPRLVTQRGVMLGQEFRYLFPRSTGSLQTNWMPDDREADRTRWRYSFLNQSQLSERWTFTADINRVSDDAYIVDFGDSLSAQATSVLPSIAGFYTRGLGYSAGLMADQYEILDPANPNSLDPYKRLPRAYFQWNGGQTYWRYGLDSEAVRFDRDAGPVGNRFDAQPYVGFSWQPGFGFVEPRAAWRYTAYDLRNNSDNSLSRSVPILSLDSGLYFDRFGAFGKPNWRQTLEPRLYYLNVPFRDQQAIPVFDTGDLDFTFNQLFRDNRFSGADRQGDANQLTLALTSRLFDDALGREIVRASVGQIRYFDQPRVQLPGGVTIDNPTSVFVGEIAARITDKWNMAYTLQYDPTLEATRVAGLRVQYRANERSLANFGYRYRRGRLEQVDISGLWPVNEQWSVIGRVNHSLVDRRTLESLGGFEYRSCCLAARVLFRHYVRTSALDSDNAVYFELEFAGLGSIGRKTGEILSRAIIGYQPTTF